MIEHEYGGNKKTGEDTRLLDLAYEFVRCKVPENKTHAQNQTTAVFARSQYDVNL